MYNSNIDTRISMKKKLIIFFDCHGNEISKYLNLHEKFMEDYEVIYLNLNDYVVKGGLYYNNVELSKTHILNLQQANILILQVIEKNRKFLNNDEVIKYCSQNCLIIKIPHYRNSIYEYKIMDGLINKNELFVNGDFNYKWSLPFKIMDYDDIEKTTSIIKNEINIMNEIKFNEYDMKKSLNFKIGEFELIDKLSDIKMNDYFLANYKKYRLFQSRSYPSSIFFNELTNRILNKIGYNENIIFKDFYFAENTYEPITEYWYKFANFEFSNKHYVFGHIEVQDYEWYYILLLSKNPNICSKEENLKILNKIRKI